MQNHNWTTCNEHSIMPCKHCSPQYVTYTDVAKPTIHVLGGLPGHGPSTIPNRSRCLASSLAASTGSPTQSGAARTADIISESWTTGFSTTAYTMAGCYPNSQNPKQWHGSEACSPAFERSSRAAVFFALPFNMLSSNKNVRRCCSVVGFL